MGRSFPRWLAGAAVVLAFLASDARAQYFGRNKVRYDREDVRVLSTEHFDIYYSQDAAASAVTAARLADRWFTRLSTALNHSLTGRHPIVLYGSHRRFEQTNLYPGLIDENTGGFTESHKRRIVVPFGASLAETDHVLGHEIVHAFQYDMAARYRTGLFVPLWFIEGMAEYLSLGPADPLTAMWMRDAVRSGTLPSIRALASPRHFPYRWGAALWSYLAGRYGPDLPARALRTKKDVATRLQTLTGLSLDQLSTDWHAALRETYGRPPGVGDTDRSRTLISGAHGGGRLNLAAALSPDGRRIVFLSERDQFSVDVFLADAASGAIVRKLITTATDTTFESLQYLHSAGTWDPSGQRFALATVRDGRPVLTLIDIDGNERTDIPLAQLDEAYSPAWSPDGRTIAFSAMRGGFSNLYAIDMQSRAIRQLTDDAFADLQPAWSPDGGILAFVTDRFSSDLPMLRFGPYQVGLLDIASNAISTFAPMSDASQIDPVWSPDGSSLYLVADLTGVSNVFRVNVSDRRVFQVTDVDTGVSGVTRLSPAVSVASRDGALAFNVFRRGAYEIHTIREAAALAGAAVDVAPAAAWGAPSSSDSQDDERVDPVPALPAPQAVRPPDAATNTQYVPRLGLEGVASPYFSAGGGPFGSYVQGGASLLFADLMGDRLLLTAIHVSSALDESAFGAVYLNRTSRWNWGATLEQSPDVRYTTTGIRIDPARVDSLLQDRERRVWTTRALGGFVAYPLNRSHRIEFSAGLREIGFTREGQRQEFSRTTGRLLDTEGYALPSEPSLAFAEAGVAFVGDTAIFGATAPLVGSRYRLEVKPAIGGLTYTGLLVDYRRYLMPVRPYTIALRALHLGRYGGDSDDERLRESYLGSSSLVRGYGGSDVLRADCPNGIADCPALNRLLGTRLLVAKLEIRVPVMGALSSRVKYGPLPVDAFAFADAGTVWGGSQHVYGPSDGNGIVIRSVGAGVRANAMGLIFELAAVRPLDLHRRGWTFAFNLRPGF